MVDGYGRRLKALGFRLKAFEELGGWNVIRKKAWLFCRTSSGVRLFWELEEPQGPKKKDLKVQA